MKRSTDRFLTTHTGSLTPPDDLIRTMFARVESVPVDAAALAARIRSAVLDVVGRQAAAGIDVVDDGEMSKPSYATYIKDRLTGFGGASQPLQYRDLVDFPGMAKRGFGDPGRARRPGVQRPHRRARGAGRPDRRGESPGRPRRGHRRGGIHERGLAGGHLALLQERALPEPRALRLRHRRRDAPRVRDGGPGRPH